MTSQELAAKYDALSDEQKDDFDVKLHEYAVTLLNPNQGPYDNAHWHKVPPSPIIAPPVDIQSGTAGVLAASSVAPTPVASAPALAPPKKANPFWGWMH